MSGEDLPAGRKFDSRGRSRGRGQGRGFSSDVRGRGSGGYAIYTGGRGRGAPVNQLNQRGDHKNSRQEVEPLEAQAKGDLLSTVDLDAVRLTASRDGGKVWSLLGCEFVASYNLLHHRHTTILVPGMQPLIIHPRALLLTITKGRHGLGHHQASAQSSDKIMGSSSEISSKPNGRSFPSSLELGQFSISAPILTFLG